MDNNNNNYNDSFIELNYSQIIDGSLKPGMLIKAIPINLSKTTLFGYVIHIDPHSIPFKTKILIKFNNNKFITFKPSNYSLFYKIHIKSSTRTFFESILNTSNDDLLKFNKIKLNYQ